MMQTKLSDNKGFSMVEVLVTLVILAIGLLGLAALQVNSLRQNTSAYERSVASLLAYEMIDRMHANIFNPNAYLIDLSDEPPADAESCIGVGADCSRAEMVRYDLAAWKCSLGAWEGEDQEVCNELSIEGILPGGDGAITLNGNRVTVIVRWLDNRNAETEDERWLTLETSAELGAI